MHTTASLVSAPTRGHSMEIGDHFFAHSFRFHDFGGLMNPLLMVDHFWMREDTFGRHPHAGFSALTYVFPDSQSAHYNRDSMGSELPIKPGDLHWFAAGRGGYHHEFPEKKNSQVHAMQIFVDLPLELKQQAPYALHLDAEDVPEWAGDKARVRVVAGELNGVQSPLRAPQPFYLLDGYLEAGGTVDVPVPEGWGAWLYAVEGVPSLGDVEIPQAHAVALRVDEPMLAVSSVEKSHFLLMAGALQNA